MRPGDRCPPSMACCALMTKFSVTCSSSVKFALTCRTEDDSTSSAIRALSRSALRSWTTSAMTSRMSTSVSGPGCWLLNRDEVADDLAGASALRLHERDFGQHVGTQTLMRSSSSTVPRIACSGLLSSCATPDTSRPTAVEALLPDDLALQRLQHLAHLAFLLELPIERVARVAKPERPCWRTRPGPRLSSRLGDRLTARPATSRRPRFAARRFCSCFRSRTNRRDSHSARDSTAGSR